MDGTCCFNLLLSLHVIFTVLTKWNAATNTFEYTACTWKDSMCIQNDTEDLFPSDHKQANTSFWPRGPYALVTPKEGCPESFSKGWRRGHISFTWKQPHIFAVQLGCDFDNTTNGTTLDEQETRFRSLLPEFWPDAQSNLLGPFSKYSMRLNFCFKTDGGVDVNGSVPWPGGNYSLFGDSSGCPSGFQNSERVIKLPPIFSWTSYGSLPEFAVKSTDKNGSVDLILKICDHEQANITRPSDDLESYPVFAADDSFVFIKKDKATSCPQMMDMNVSFETLHLLEDFGDINSSKEIFTICHYQPMEWTIDLGTYLYNPRDDLQSSPEDYDQAFVITNPTHIYGNKTTTVGNSRLQGVNVQTFSTLHKKTITPWLLIDLGRNLIVTGLQFTNVILPEINSQDYAGYLVTTISGYPCQRWDSQSPHRHNMVNGGQFPEKSVFEARNYCRDPDGTGWLWCYTQNPNVRWDYCSYGNYRFQQEDQPFSKCFISTDRWRIEEFGAVYCIYSIVYQSQALYMNYNFRKEQEGRYIKLVGYDGEDSSSFIKATQKVQVLTSTTILHDDGMCNEDLGMADESIRDSEISQSIIGNQYPPTNSRPFYPGWCTSTTDINPHIKIVLPRATTVEGITVYNWERNEEAVINGEFRKIYTPFGSMQISVAFPEELEDGTFVHQNRTLTLDRYLPVEQPQTFFFHTPVTTEYVIVEIMDSLTENANCLRLELLGCRKTGQDTSSLPELVAVEWMLRSDIHGDTITYNNLQTVTNIADTTTVLSNTGYPCPYPGGVSYSWIIDFPVGKFISLLFLNTSFNEYEDQCGDTLKFLPGAYKGETMSVDKQFNDKITILKTDVSYTALTFATCRPTKKIKKVGHGFRVIVNVHDIPTCFSTRGIVNNIFSSSCVWRMMYLLSLSRFNFPDYDTLEEWTIKVNRFSIRLKITYFNVRCDTGSSLQIKDRFSEATTFCNLRKVLPETFSDSESLRIKFEKGQKATSGRRSAREGFQAQYTTVAKSMEHLIDSQRHHAQALKRLTGLEQRWDPHWKNATLLVYQACSKRFGKCYFIYTGAQASSSWESAGADCWIRNSGLVTIHSDEEHELIKYILRTFRYFSTDTEEIETAFFSDTVDPTYFTHIGLSRVTTKNGGQLHMWEDGSPVSFSAWNKNEPSEAGDCTRMSFHLFDTNNTWEAENCESGLATYVVCERGVTPELLNMREWVTKSYNGTLNVTLSGITCQRWDSQYPFTHKLEGRDDLFPDGSVSNAENYCRDPVDNGYIWCYTMDHSTRWEKCREEDAANTVPSQYSGRLSTTSSGRTCQRWNSETPHSHMSMVASAFPDASVKDASNYCRDPDGSATLWCYTTDPNKRWETCNFIDTASDRCYSTHYQYTGQWNETKSGIACQDWMSQEPHDHELFTDSQFPDESVANASNYCRDPYNEGFLWCFTVDPALRSEQCLFEYEHETSGKSFKDISKNGTFHCGNGQSVSLEYVCDGIPNCKDLTDEINCPKAVHPLLENMAVLMEIPNMAEVFSVFQCDSKEWISLLSRCDGVIDCIDASDELDCSATEQTGASGCLKNHYACDTGVCIHLSQMCDFIADCTDSSDENCDYPICASNEYRCRNQQCISVEKRCDAYEDCLDGTDETGCDICQNNTLHCDLTRCIPRRLVCDNYPDCKDGSDEMSCDQPVHLSCEEWWLAGYRKTGKFKLNGITDVECNFDGVDSDGVINTIFHNFEVTQRAGVEIVHFNEGELKERFNNQPRGIFYNSLYTCSQNITQKCTPAYKAVADTEDPDNKNAFTHCDCLVMTVNLSHYDANYSDVYFCDSGDPVLDRDSLLFFNYTQSGNKRNITLRDTFPEGVEVTFGPVVCTHDAFREKDIGCGNGNTFPEPLRCVYDTDHAGYIDGCRSGQHLQGCESFQCPENTVKCPGSFCIPLKFVCEGDIQCPNGEDEQNCDCEDIEREVLLLVEDGINSEEIRNIGVQFFNAKSTVRVLQYRVRTFPHRLDNEQKVLEISDIEIDPFRLIDRQFVCNYSILASDFIENVMFSKTGSRGLIFFENNDINGTLSKALFGGFKTRPAYLIYKVEQVPDSSTTSKLSFPFVKDVTVNRWSTLATVGARYFPDLCTGLETAKVSCPHGYKCFASKICIGLHQVCDGFSQCTYGDDERACSYSCPDTCSCEEYKSDCSYRSIDNNTIHLMNRKSRSIDVSGNPGLQKALVSSEWRFPYLILLNVSTCGMDEIAPNIFQSLVNLRILDLSFNNFHTIPSYAFIGLRRLTYLSLHGNKAMYSLESYSLNGLLSLRSLEIRQATLSRVSAHAFSGLTLNQLNMSKSKILEIEDDVFSGLNVKVMDIETNDIEVFNKGLFRGASGLTSLHTPVFKFCCVKPNYLTDEQCFPERDEFSSCDDLIRLPALQTMLWLIGIVALFGNVLSVVYRLLYDREKLKLGYGIFVTNLAVADFFMGVYLIIIAIADAAFKKRYIFMDATWRRSAWCTLAGFLSTVSSEASVLFLCLITLDRLFVIKFPFGQVRFDTKKSGIACLVSWIVSVLIGLIPIVHSNHFHDRFYSKSGVCIALPLTRDRPPGWLYSIIIFVGLNFVTFCLVAIGQCAIYYEIKKSTSGIRHSSSIRGKGGNVRRRELTVARNLLFVVATDFLCWFPIGCMGIMSVFGHVVPGDVYAWTAVFVLPVNSALNPVLYTLTAILGKKKAQTQTETRMSSIMTSVSVKRVRPFNGLFRYFINHKDTNPESFVSLNDLVKREIPVTTTDVARIMLNLVRCLSLLHKNCLIFSRLDGNVVYITVEHGKIVGGIQLRQEPVICYDSEKKADDISQLAQILRTLLAKRNKMAKMTNA